ncbi:MAG: hypothetical protein JWR85_3842, partial [Marmoricola sp.]|nr:hypothetical protein [Marmoricola sp.]
MTEQDSLDNKTHCRNGHNYSVVGFNIFQGRYKQCLECKRAGTAKHRDIKNFGGNREKAIQRDGEKCVKCGITRAEHSILYKKDITVDHIDGLGVGQPVYLKNNSLENLQTLCSVCHKAKDN